MHHKSRRLGHKWKGRRKQRKHLCRHSSDLSHLGRALAAIASCFLNTFVKILHVMHEGKNHFPESRICITWHPIKVEKARFFNPENALTCMPASWKTMLVYFAIQDGKRDERIQTSSLDPLCFSLDHMWLFLSFTHLFLCNFFLSVFLLLGRFAIYNKCISSTDVQGGYFSPMGKNLNICHL